MYFAPAYRFFPVLVKRREAGQGQRGHFDADVEQHEAARRNHKVHPQQGGEENGVKFALPVRRYAQPPVGLQEHQQRAEAQNVFHQHGEGGGYVHAAKGAARLGGDKAKRRVQAEQRARRQVKVRFASPGSQKIVHEQDNKHRYQAYFLTKQKKIAKKWHNQVNYELRIRN